MFIMIYRASKLLATLENEELQNLINGRVYPEIEPGDSISIDILPYSTSKTTENMKGVVIGIVNNGCDSLIKMINVSLIWLFLTQRIMLDDG